MRECCSCHFSFFSDLFRLKIPRSSSKNLGTGGHKRFVELVKGQDGMSARWLVFLLVLDGYH